jgi:hypothetical protein
VVSTTSSSVLPPDARRTTHDTSANDICRKDNRSKITEKDILAALAELELHEFTPELQAFLQLLTADNGDDSGDGEVTGATGAARAAAAAAVDPIAVDDDDNDNNDNDNDVDEKDE